MRGLALRGLALVTAALAAGVAAGCADTVRTSQPMYDSSAGAGGGGQSGSGGAASGTDGGGLGGSGGTASGGQSGQAGQSATGGGTGGVVSTGGHGGAAGGPGGLSPAPATGLASLNSDYQTTSLSLLNSSGGVVNPSCVHSANLGNGTSKTISGDAVLASQPQRGGNVVIVDRGNGALTFVDPAGCFIARQIAIPGGAKNDPHDVAILSDHKAYVTRYQPNLASANNPQQAGNDVLVMDPSNGTYLDRISMDAYASRGASTPVLARPDRALIADGRVIVSLNQIDASYATYGDGAIVVIDPTNNMVVASVALPGLYDCEGMDFVAASHALLVACGGAFAGQDQPLQSGIAVVDLGANPPRLDHVVSSVAFDGHPMNFGWVLGAGTAAAPARAFAGTFDPKGIAPDAVFQFDFVTGAVVPVTTSAAFSLGSPALADQLLFVPESLASAPKVQLFDVTSGPQPISGFTPDTANGLPPRQIAWY